MVNSVTPQGLNGQAFHTERYPVVPKLCKVADLYRKGMLIRWEGVPYRYDFLKEHGYRPIISTVTGAFRVVKHLISLFHDIVAFPIVGLSKVGQAVADRDLKRAFLNLRLIPLKTGKAVVSSIAHIARGAIEMVPLAGNGLCYTFDKISARIWPSKDKELFTYDSFNWKKSEVKSVSDALSWVAAIVFVECIAALDTMAGEVSWFWTRASYQR